MPLQPGDAAPDFTLRDQHGQDVQLSTYGAGKAVLLVFFPFAFSGVCTGELTGFRDRLGEFETDSTTLLTLSTDPMYTQRAFADRDALFFPLLSDFWPHGAVATSYDVFDAEQGCSQRSAYVIDRHGKITWGIHNEMGQARDLTELAGALARA